jgi:HD-like signal output (HDOD) protein
METTTAKLLDQLESGRGLPVLSPVAIQLVELASDDSSSAQDLVNLIEKDPSLVSRLLKLANNVFYHASVPISTPTQAVIRVGFDRLRVMALSISLRDTFPMGKVGPLDYEKFWRTSLYRAFICKSLAASLEYVHPEEAFVAGLLMEIGMLLFFEMFIKDKDEEVTLKLDPLQDLLAWERKNFDVDHRQMGRAALAYWRFPAPIIECQGNPSAGARERTSSGLCKICELAASWAQILIAGSSGFHVIFEQAEQELDLGQEVVNEILLQAFTQVDEVAAQFQLESKREKDLLLLMEMANRTLSRISERISATTFSSAGEHLPSLASVPREDRAIQYTLQAVAHEIRNPLTAVGGFARKLAEALDPLSEGGKYAHFIVSEAERLEKVLAEVTKASDVQES